VPIPLEALFCESCDGYVHPFLDACPGCGAPHGSLYDAVVREPDLGLRALLEEPRVTDMVRGIVARYSLRSIGTPTATEVVAAFSVVAESLAYDVRVVGPGEARSKAAYVELAADDLVVRERNPSREVARVPLVRIVAARAASKGDRGAGGWAGLVAFGRRESDALPAVDGNLVVTFGGPDGPGRVAFANRRGLTVARGRPDHYAIMARWLAIIAAVAAESRWLAIGPARHAAEIGLAAPAPAAPATAAIAASPAGGPTIAVPAAPPSEPAMVTVTEALATLEELRARGLVTEAEYADKRREILARL
jgi:Short C-terminal domain